MKLFDLFATLTLDTRDFERDTKGAMATARNLSSSITNSVSASTVALGNLMAQGVTTLAKTVYGFGGDLVQSSASLKAAEAAYSATFRGIEGEAGEAFKGVAEETGILENRLKNVGTKAFAQFLGAGMGEADALKQMERYLKMAADAAARYDITLEDADARLRSFLRGNTEAGDMIGLFTSESQRSAYALERYGEDWNKLSESQKQWLMMDVAKDIYDISKVTGTAAEEADGWANVIANLSDAWNKSKGLMGGGIQDAMTPMLQELTAFLSKEETKTKLTEFGNTLGDISGYAFDGVTGFLKDLQTGEYDGTITIIKGFADAFTDTKISANLGAFVGHLKTASGLTFTGVKEFFADSIPEGDNAVWTNVAALAEDFTGLLAAIPPETLSAVETGLLGMFAAMKPGWAGLLTLGLVAANWKEIKSATEGALEASNAYFTEGKLPTLNEEQKKQLNESYETLNKLSTLTFGFELPDWSLVTAWAASRGAGE